MKTTEPIHLGLLCANQEDYLLRRESFRQANTPLPPSLVWSALWLTGHLDDSALSATLNDVLSRHGALRTAITVNPDMRPDERAREIERYARTGQFRSGIFLQTVRRQCSPELEHIDAGGLNAQQLEDYLRLLRGKVQSSPTDYESPPLMKAFLIRVAPLKHLLIIALDHLIADGESTSVLENEIIQIYSHQCGTRKEPLPEPPLSLLEFGASEYRTFDSGGFDKELTHWRNVWERFGSARISLQQLPLYKQRHSDFRYSFSDSVIFGARASAIRQFCRQRRVTLYMFFVSVYALLLSVYTGKRRVAIWGHFSNRTRPESLQTIGYLANSHLLGFDLEGLSADQVILSARATIEAAIRHQALPLPHLWRALSCHPRFSDAAPLLRFISTSQQVSRLSDSLSIQPATLPRSASVGFSSLGATVSDNGTDFAISIRFPTAAFSEAVTNTFAADFKEVALKVIGDCLAPVGRIGKSVAQDRSGTDAGPGLMADFIISDSRYIPDVPDRRPPTRSLDSNRFPEHIAYETHEPGLWHESPNPNNIESSSIR